MNVYRVWGLGVLGLRLRVQGLEFLLKVQGLGFRGVGSKAYGPWIRVWVNVYRV